MPSHDSPAQPEPGATEGPRQVSSWRLGWWPARWRQPQPEVAAAPADEEGERDVEPQEQVGNGADLQTGNSEDSTHTAVIDIPTDASSSHEAPPGGGPVHEPSPPPSLPPIATTAADAASGSQRARTDPARPYRHWLTRWRGLRERPAAGDGGSEADSTPATPLLADAAWEAAAEGASSRMEEDEEVAERMEDDGEDGGGADRSSCLPAGSSLSRYVSRLSDSLGRSRSVASLAGGQHGACLICLEPFTPEELESGEAIALDCECRGEVAMRHYACAVKWIKVKGDLVCDVCKAEVKNLPAPTPPASESDGESYQGRPSAFGASYSPWRHEDAFGDRREDGMDSVYDCLKVVWIVMIVCVLFFDLPFYQSLWAGVIIGTAYTTVSRIYAALQRAAMRYHLQSQLRADADAPPSR